MAQAKLDFSVISLNTRSIPLTKSRIRLRAIARELEYSSASFVSLQEIHTFTHLLLLKRSMPSFPYVSYTPSFYGPKSGLVTFSRQPIKQQSFVRFSKLGALYNKSIIARILRNGMLITEFASSPVVLINTHLTPNTDLDWNENNRFYSYIETQLLQLAEVTNKLTAEGKQVIIAGDLNSPKGSILYREFLEKSHAVDLFSSFDYPTYHSEYLKNGKIPQRLDYIFMAGSHASSASFHPNHRFTEKVVQGDSFHYLSDHIGLEATISLNLS